MSIDDDEMPEIATNEEWRGIMVRARKDHGLTQEELAAKVGTSQPMIFKIETGKSGSSTYVKRICKVLSIPLPVHYEDERDRAWAQLGHVLRNSDPAQYDALLNLAENMVRNLEAGRQREDYKRDETDESPTTKRK